VDERTLEILERRRRGIGAFVDRGWLVRRSLLVADIFGLSLTFCVVQLVIGSAPQGDRYSSLAEVGFFVATLPLWVIAATVPWPVAFAAVSTCGFFVPMVNAPLMGLLSTRPPLAVRTKVMTAVMTASGLGSPVGRLVGPIFTRWGNGGVWVAIAGGLTAGSLLFVAAVLRAGSQPAPATAAIT